MPAAKANPSGKKITKKSAPKKVASVTKPKKKPVKKVVKKVTNKSAPKKVTSVVKPKQKVAKKTPKGVKAKTAHNINQSPLNVKGDAKANAVREVALEHLFKKHPATSSTKASSGKTVRLPSNISLRALEKVKVISALLDDSVVEKVRKGAYGLSFSFILIGSFFALNAIGHFGEGSFLNTALVSNFSSTSSTTQLFNEIYPPKFRQIDVVPVELNTNAKFSFELLNVEKFETRLINLNTRETRIIDAKKTADNQYTYELSIETLEVSDYKLKVVAQGLAGFGEYVFTSATFSVVASEVIQEEVQTLAETETELPVEEVVEKVVEVVEAEINPENVKPEDFTVFLSKTLFNSSSLVYLQVPPGVDSVSVYTQKVNSFTSTLIGKASKDLGTWRFFLDVTNMPNGKYDLIIKGIKSGIPIESRPKRIEISKLSLETEYSLNKIAVPVRTEEEPPADITETLEELSSETRRLAEPSTLPRDFSELSLAPIGQEVTGVESEKIVTEFLRNRKSSLEILLRNYSAAMQSGDKIAIALAKEALAEEKKSIVEANVGATEGVSREIDKRFASLQNRIEVFEDLRRNSNDGLTAMDSDEDGISDFDEKALFKTDPNNPDTDEDGILDGIEIMRGYNPLNPVSEAVLLYESPKDSLGLTKSDDLIVSNVTPIVEVVGDESDNSTVQARIVGRALPNMYVTLYVFSSPTIVTVKTDESGGFSYLFENELEDGTHEVYVAITDNTGEIIAQSNPFSFTKRAEAFTTGTVASAPSDTTGTSDSSPYNVAIGLAILALGIILLMLGIGLRPQTPAVTTEATT